MKQTLQQGMANGVASEVVGGIQALRTSAHVIHQVTGCDLGKAYEAATQLAVEGGQAREEVMSRYGHLNCAQIAKTLASRPSESVASPEKSTT